MVLLDLNLVQAFGLSSRQASVIEVSEFKKSSSLASINFKKSNSVISNDVFSNENLESNQKSNDLNRNESTATTSSNNGIPKAVRRASHLYLQAKGITSISRDIGRLRQLKVLYLYDNKLKSAETLSHAVNLTHVYLMNNQLTTTKGFSKLRNLEKLYLSNNKIEVVEDLILNPMNHEYDPKLKELHIENQLLPTGHSLIFDPECLNNLSFSLQVLNISNNNISSVEYILEALNKSLYKFYCSGNNIRSLTINSDEIKFPFLEIASFKNNPFQRKLGSKKYRKLMVVTFHKLRDLDHGELSDFERKWHQAFYEREQRIRAYNERLEGAKIAESGQSQNNAANLQSSWASLANSGQQQQQSTISVPHAAYNPNNSLSEEQMIQFAQSAQQLQQQGDQNTASNLTQKFQSMSATDFAPPVPEHWRKKGLPGGRKEFDKILEKARAKAHERLLSKTELLGPEQQANFAKSHADLGDYQKINGENDMPQPPYNFGEGMLPSIHKNQSIGKDNNSSKKEKKINLQAMRLAPLDEFQMQGDN